MEVALPGEVTQWHARGWVLTASLCAGDCAGEALHAHRSQALENTYTMQTLVIRSPWNQEENTFIPHCLFHALC